MQYITVFCGSRYGNSARYREGAVQLGRELARRNLTLVYGGAHAGLMGALADAALEAGGQVIGIIPTFLRDREIAHGNLTKLVIVENMHERKRQMGKLADGFIVLPGGLGTMEEFFEVFSWHYIGLHRKPCGILNIDGYYDPLLALLDHMTEQAFMPPDTRRALIVDDDAARLLDKLTVFAGQP